MQLIYYILVAIVLKILWPYVNYTPTDKCFNCAYGSSKDSIGTIIDRIDWANHYKGRIPHTLRYLFCAIILTFLILFIYENSVPKFSRFIQCLFISWIVLVAFYEYTQHHGDKYAHYGIHRNTKLLRKKLQTPKKTVKPSDIIFPLASDCFNFTYNGNKD